MIPTAETVRRRFVERFGDCSQYGWHIKLSNRFEHCDTDAWYEATVDGLVTPDTLWLDVGGGKSAFPFNKPLADTLAARCRRLVVVDPSGAANAVAHETAACMIEDYQTDRKFDLVTMRMVAEHIEHPDRVVAHLAALTKPGAHIVLVTPNRWSPVTIASALIPYRFHMPITRFLWNTSDDDVFPAVYRMNTRGTLRKLFERHGFAEAGFRYCSNCTTFIRFQSICTAELAVWRALDRLGIVYPENNLLGVYQRCGESGDRRMS